MIKKFFISIIKIYQKTLSPDHGPLAFLFSEGFCRFRPTCSQYSIDAIEKFGTLKGSVLGFYRINRCNPWARGGADEAIDAKPRYFRNGLILIFIYSTALFVLIWISARLLTG